MAPSVCSGSGWPGMARLRSLTSAPTYAPSMQVWAEQHRVGRTRCAFPLTGVKVVVGSRGQTTAIARGSGADAYARAVARNLGVAAEVLAPVDDVHAPARLREDPRDRGAGESRADDGDLHLRYRGFNGGKFMRAALARNASSGSIVRQVGGGRRPSLASSMTGRSFANASMSRCRVRP